jgi:rhodanese-related sulfurtransferase
MGEVNLFKFIAQPYHMFLIALAMVSGGMLIWPAISRGMGGTSVSTLQATLLINQKNALVVDVRDADDFAKGHLINARHIPMAEIGPRATEIERFKSRPVIVVCERGNRSDRAAAALRKQGFDQVFSLGGGVAAWQQAGLPLEKDAP